MSPIHLVPASPVLNGPLLCASHMNLHAFESPKGWGAAQKVGGTMSSYKTHRGPFCRRYSNQSLSYLQNGRVTAPHSASMTTTSEQEGAW